MTADTQVASSTAAPQGSSSQCKVHDAAREDAASLQRLRARTIEDDLLMLREIFRQHPYAPSTSRGRVSAWNNVALALRTRDNVAITTKICHDRFLFLAEQCRLSNGKAKGKISHLGGEAMDLLRRTATAFARYRKRDEGRPSDQTETTTTVTTNTPVKPPQPPLASTSASTVGKETVSISNGSMTRTGHHSGSLGPFATLRKEPVPASSGRMTKTGHKPVSSARPATGNKGSSAAASNGNAPKTTTQQLQPPPTSSADVHEEAAPVSNRNTAKTTPQQQQSLPPSSATGNKEAAPVSTKTKSHEQVPPAPSSKDAVAVSSGNVVATKAQQLESPPRAPSSTVNTEAVAVSNGKKKAESQNVREAIAAALKAVKEPAGTRTNMSRAVVKSATTNEESRADGRASKVEAMPQQTFAEAFQSITAVDMASVPDQTIQFSGMDDNLLLLAVARLRPYSGAHDEQMAKWQSIALRLSSSSHSKQRVIADACRARCLQLIREFDPTASNTETATTTAVFEAERNRVMLLSIIRKDIEREIEVLSRESLAAPKPPSADVMQAPSSAEKPVSSAGEEPVSSVAEKQVSSAGEKQAAIVDENQSAIADQKQTPSTGVEKETLIAGESFCDKQVTTAAEKQAASAGEEQVAIAVRKQAPSAYGDPSTTMAGEADIVESPSAEANGRASASVMNLSGPSASPALPVDQPILVISVDANPTPESVRPESDTKATPRTRVRAAAVNAELKVKRALETDLAGSDYEVKDDDDEDAEEEDDEDDDDENEFIDEVMESDIDFGEDSEDEAAFRMSLRTKRMPPKSRRPISRKRDRKSERNKTQSQLKQQKLTASMQPPAQPRSAITVVLKPIDEAAQQLHKHKRARSSNEPMDSVDEGVDLESGSLQGAHKKQKTTAAYGGENTVSLDGVLNRLVQLECARLDEARSQREMIQQQSMLDRERQDRDREATDAALKAILDTVAKERADRKAEMFGMLDLLNRERQERRREFVAMMNLVTKAMAGEVQPTEDDGDSSVEA